MYIMCVCVVCGCVCVWCVQEFPLTDLVFSRPSHQSKLVTSCSNSSIQKGTFAAEQWIKGMGGLRPVGIRGHN